MREKKPEIYRFIFLLVISPVLFLSAKGYAQNQQGSGYTIDSILNKDISDELRTKGVVSHVLSKNETELTLVPHTPLSKKAASFSMSDADDDPSFVSESLHLIKKSELAANSKNKNGTSDTSLDAVSRVIRSVSKMKGMKYYSFSRNEWDTLYSESYMIDGPDSTKQIPDQLDGSADGLVLYCYQKEHTFGDCRYRLDYSQNSNEVSVLFTNIEPLYYKIFRAVKADNMKINLVVIDCEDSYLVYMVLHAKIMRFSFLEKRMNNSLNSRLDAIYQWFTVQF